MLVGDSLDDIGLTVKLPKYEDNKELVNRIDIKTKSSLYNYFSYIGQSVLIDILPKDINGYNIKNGVVYNKQLPLKYIESLLFTH